MELGLKGKIALVTGASKGIGAAIAMELGREGCSLAICSRTASELEAKADELRAETGVEVLAVPCDLSKPGEADRVVKETVNRFGRLDVLVNNAGNAPPGTLEQLKEEDWQMALQLKLMGHVRCMTAALPIMKEQGGGRVVNIIGNDGEKTQPFELAPAAANAGGIMVSRDLAEFYGPYNITINVVNPGPVLTERYDYLFDSWARANGVPFAVADRILKESIPLHRICTVEEVANVAVFLASDRASFVNGAVITLDGGQRKGVMDALMDVHTGRYKL